MARTRRTECLYPAPCLREAQTFLLPELDRETREYLLEVRDKKGKGMPGMFESSAPAAALAGHGMVTSSAARAKTSGRLRCREVT